MRGLPLFKHGFSLVELSIVLVILGLLVGGVLSGQSLIRAASLRAVATDYTKLIAAHNSFRDKYFSVPGDMTNATSFWGVRAGSGVDATCYTTINTSTGTCNGNGDGMLSDNGAASSSCPEAYLYWQHLANASLIEGKYSGATVGVGNCWQTPGINVPLAKMGSNAMWTINYVPAVSGNADYFDNSSAVNLLSLLMNASGASANQLLTPSEVWNLDTKMDDGKPATGIMYVFKNSSTLMPGCATTDVISTAQYALSTDNKTCSPRVAMK